MRRVILDETMTAIADAIRAKTGGQALLSPSDMPATIGGIVTPPTLVRGAIRPDAQLIQTYSYDKWLIADEVIESLPGYTTTATTLLASAALSPTISVDYTAYNYCIVERMLTIPKYSVTSKAKGRVEYHVASTIYEVSDIDANSFIALLNGTTKYTSRSVTVTGVTFQRLLYWSSASAVSPYSTGTYGVICVPVAPSISSGVMTVNSPNFNTRGSTTYFTSTYMGAMTDVRYQYVIDVYRAPRGNLNLDGFTERDNMAHIMSCVNATGNKLT